MRSYFIYLVAFLIGVRSIRYPFVGVMAYSFVNIVRPEMLVWGGSSASEVFKIIMIFTFIGALFNFKKLFADKIENEILFLLFIAVFALTSTVFSKYEEPFRVYSYIRELFIFAIFSFFMIRFIDSERLVIAQQRLVLIALSILGVWGWDQHFRGNERLENLAGQGFADSNGVAAMLILGLPLAINFILHAKSSIGKFIGFVSIVSIAGSIIFTQSRGGFLGLAACLLWYFFHSRRKKLLVAVFAALSFIIMPFVGENYFHRVSTISAESDQRDFSSGSRLVLWHAAVLTFFDNPLNGSGFLSAPFANLDYRGQLDGKYDDDLLNYTFNGTKVGHGTYFQVLGEGGLLMAIPFYLFIAQYFFRNRAVRLSVKNTPKTSEMLDLLNSVEAGVFGFCVCIVFINALLSPHLPMQIVCGGSLARIILKNDNSQKKVQMS